MTYPYGLKNNPYPSSPTPTEKDAEVLGGTRHIQARDAILECISDLYKQTSRKQSTESDFRLITMIQDVGCGKTHLALHIKGLKTRQNIDSSYVDFATISPKTKESLYDALIRGYNKSLFEDLREKFLKNIGEKAEGNDKVAKKVLDYNFLDRLKGITVKQKLEDILFDKNLCSKENLKRYLAINYNQHEAIVIQNIIERSFDKISNLDELLGRIIAISKFSHNLLGKVILYEFDEIDADPGTIEFIKSIINAHIPASVVMLISTPSAYSEIQKSNPSLFDRLEKANYKIDLAGSNSIDELAEISIEYIKENEKSSKFGKKEQTDLAAKVRVLCDEFPDFRSVRSILNIMYHATEKAAKLVHDEISEAAIDETIRSAFPGLKIKGSMLDIPVGEFLKLRRESLSSKSQSRIKEAISNLVNFAHDLGSVGEPKSNRSFDSIYTDPLGNKIGIAVVMDNDHAKNTKSIENIVKASAMVDKLIVITNTNFPKLGHAIIINVDKTKLVDLLYFNERYIDHKISEPENEKIQMLAKTISVI